MTDLDFVIVGTPRSGTTLVQRIASEIPEVVVPPETHVLSRFLPDLLARRSFPLQGPALRDEVDRYLALPTSRGLPTSRDAVVTTAGGRCERPLDLYVAVVRAMTGEAALVGEKTPEHLPWWRPLTRALPDLRVVAVVRDPRGVMASHAEVPWGIRSAGHLAEQWRLDQQQVLAATREREDLTLVLRYEDVVGGPDQARRRLARFLGADPGRVVDPDEIVLGWEWWKQRASRPVEADRAARWHQALRPEVADEVASVAGTVMERFGYPTPRQSLRTRARTLRSAPGRRRFRHRKQAALAAIEATDLKATGDRVRATGRSSDTGSSQIPNVPGPRGGR